MGLSTLMRVPDLFLVAVKALSVLSFSPVSRALISSHPILIKSLSIRHSISDIIRM